MRKMSLRIKIQPVNSQAGKNVFKTNLTERLKDF